MVFDFNKLKLKLEKSDFKFAKRTGKNYIDWTAKKPGLWNTELKLIRVMNNNPNLDDLAKFVKDAEKFNEQEGLDAGMDEIIFISPNFDERALKFLIDKSEQGDLKRLIKIKTPDTQSIQVKPEVVKEVIQKEVEKLEFHEKIIEESKDVTFLNEIIKAASEFTIHHHFSKEKDIEFQLFSYLEGKFPNFSVDYQKGKSGAKVDIVIDDKFGVEIKVANNKAELDRLVGQVMRYRRDFKYILAVIIHTRKIPESELKSVVKTLESSDNVRVVVR